jgi:pyruvate formate lyase activating enzyme
VKIGGLQKLTLIDYPQKVACTVFLSGCNLRCPWCYSPELVLPEKIKKHPQIEEADFFDFLDKRKGKLDGVVVCGGEPTIYSGIYEFIGEIKKRGFLVKIDTNGLNPDTLKKLVRQKLLDYIAMDVKLPLSRYKELSKDKLDSKRVKESIDFIMKSGIDHEFRTTVIPDVHGKKDIQEIGEIIRGANKYYLQNFFPEKTLEESFLLKEPFSEEKLEEFKKVASLFVEKCEIR